MRLTNSEVDLLLEKRAISTEWPWSTNDETVIDKHIHDVVAEVRWRLRLKDKTEYGHYGSGYASFVDCWLYRPDDEFRCGPGEHYYGLVVLFSRLSHFYVVGQGDKSWTPTGGASYLPGFEIVDSIDHQAVLRLVQPVTGILADRGLTRLRKMDLETVLPSNISVPTILGERMFRQFDAMFYWED